MKSKAQTLDQFIARLQSLRVYCGGDAPVLVQVEEYPAATLYEIAMAEISNVQPPEFGAPDEELWCSRHDKNNPIQAVTIC